MKKVFFILVASIALSSCIKTEYSTPGPRGPQGPQGPQGRDGYGTYIDTYYFDVQPNQWKTYGDFGTKGYYCYAELNIGGLNASVINDGAVLVYFIEEIDGQDYDNQLPYILPFYDRGYFIRTIRYDLQTGVIAFIVQDSDFNVPSPPFGTGKVTFKVVIISKI